MCIQLMPNLSYKNTRQPPTNTTKATVSAWVRRMDDHQGIFGVMNSGNNHINVQLDFLIVNGICGIKTARDDYFLQDSSQVPRDPHGLDHVVYRFDTTQGSTLLTD